MDAYIYQLKVNPDLTASINIFSKVTKSLSSFLSVQIVSILENMNGNNIIAIFSKKIWVMKFVLQQAPVNTV